MEFCDGTTDTTTNTPVHEFADKSKSYWVCLTYDDPITKKKAQHCDSVTAQQMCAQDIVKPVAKCKPYSIGLVGGKASIVPSNIDNGSTDDCAIQSRSIDKSSFTIAGSYPVKLLIKDWNNNDSICTSIVTITPGTLIDYANFKGNLNVYPNPFNNNLTISYDLLENSSVEVSIFDMLGKRVALVSALKQAAGAQLINYDASLLDAGTYILQLRTSTGILNKQAIVKK